MANAKLKTQPTKQTIAQFIATIKDPAIQKDCKTLAKMMQATTKDKGKMWGSAIVGFGECHMKYASGRELDWFSTGFSPRKKNITLYLLMGYKNKSALLKKLGKHSVGGSCLYIQRLSDVDPKVLRQLIDLNAKEAKKKYLTSEAYW